MKPTHNFRDCRSDKVHLVHVRSQHIEVLREGRLRRGNMATGTEKAQSTQAHGRLLLLPQPQLLPKSLSLPPIRSAGLNGRGLPPASQSACSRAQREAQLLESHYPRFQGSLGTSPLLTSITIGSRQSARRHLGEVPLYHTLTPCHP